MPDDASPNASPPAFLADGGEMGALIRAHDWAATALGAPEIWPQGLKGAVRTMLTTRHPAFIFWGPDAICLYNDAYAASLDAVKHPAILGVPGEQAWRERWDEIGPQVGLVMRGDGASWREKQLLTVRRNGRMEEVYWTYSQVPIDHPTAPHGVGGVLVLCSETTGQVLADRAHAAAARAAESETRFRSMADAAPVMMWVTDAMGYCTYLNSRWYEFTGQTIGQSEGYGWLDATHPHDRRMAEEAFVTANAARGYFRIEYRLRRADGVYRWAIDAAAPRFDEDGAYLGYVGSVIDIDDRREIEQRAIDSEESLRVAMAAGRQGSWEFDVASMTLTASPQCKADYGRDPDSPFDYADLLACIHPDDQARMQAAVARSIGGGGDYDIEYRIVRPDGGIGWVMVRGRTRHAGDGTALRMAGVSSDISTRKETELALLVLNDTLEQRVIERTAELEQAQEALRQSQKMEAVGQLTGGIAHDFNNLLTGMLGNLEMLEVRASQGRTDGVDRFIAAAQGAGQRAASLTQRLLAFSRRQTLDPRPTDIDRLVSGMDDLVRRTVGPAIALDVAIDADLWPALIDPGQLENALLNLCINARDAMPDGGALKIAANNTPFDEGEARHRDLPPGDYVLVCVSDTGTGMPPDVVARAFDPFFTTKPLGQGTGLGLSMIYGFARQSGGQVRIDSAVGHGASVCIYLPRHRGPVEIAPAKPRFALPPGAGRTVLIVDDEPPIRRLASEVLTEAGHVVLEAGDGAAGLRMLADDAEIALLITDVGLPGGMNGRQVADAARALRPDLPVLFITGYAENAAVGGAHLVPGMALLTKPFAMADLSARVRELLG